MADVPFVDTHVHFWDLANPDLHYSWLQPGWVHPVLGDIDELKVPLWVAEHLRLETRNANVSKVVHVQSALGIEDPVQETLWLERAAQRTGFPHAIMAHTDLKSPSVEAELARHAETSGRLRGIRDFSSGDYLVDPAFARGCRALAKYGLVLGFEATWEDMGKAARLAQSVPDTVFMIDHTGWPRSRTDEYFEQWRTGMRALAEADNAWCKVSGLGMNDNAWTVASLRPWVLEAVEIFGVERCVLGTNWPVDKLYSSYDALIEAYAEILSGFSPDEQTALFCANAERVFAI
jgi:predicted TIM-barrel fold metal-dependent hydrolase